MAELTKLGRYQILRVLGRGAMGVVYEGFDPTLGRRVAVKTILKNAAIDEETARAYSVQFSREARAAGRLNHPHIVQIHDFAEERDIAYLVMEFIEGRELRSYFEAKEIFDAAETVRIMGELLDALEFAHGAGVVHRDVKPANIMMDVQRRVKLADFGVARIQDAERSAAGTMVGTPAYMSPEQWNGDPGTFDERTDIYGLGGILFFLLCGAVPNQVQRPTDLEPYFRHSPVPKPSDFTPRRVPPELEVMCLKCLARDPNARFTSIFQMRHELRSWLGRSEMWELYRNMSNH